MGIKVNIDDAISEIDNVINLAGDKGLRRLRTDAQREMNSGIGDAFAKAADPSTGKAWADRKATTSPAETWPLLWRTGNLMRAIRAESNVLGGTLRIKAVAQAGGSGSGSMHEIAGALFYGRKASAPGGKMPGRRFAGISPQGAQSLASTWDSLLNRR